MDMQLIHQLSDGRFHSGEALGAVLGISRAGVWKRLQALARVGLDIERVRGKGYRLAGGLSLLDREKILAHIRDVQIPSVEIKAETGSTNVDALYLARDMLKQPAAVFSEYQSSGRGRRGRDWQMPFAAGLALSLAVEFSGGAARLEGLSLAVGVCLAELLESEGVQGVSLKWPNDILVNERKLGGVLIELAGDLDASCRAVIGVGVNMALPSALQIDQPFTDLATELGGRQDRSRWAGLVLSALLRMTDQFKRDGFAGFQSRWDRFDVSRDRAVRVLQGGNSLDGVARGVSDLGALRLQSPDGMVELHGGEISLRLR